MPPLASGLGLFNEFTSDVLLHARRAAAMKFFRPVALVQLAVVLAIGLQVAARVNPPHPAAAPQLAAAVPAKLEGWTVTDEPLGSSPEATAWVARTLNFDQAVQRVYSRDGTQFTVFAAYWNRGKMPARAVAVHTPDCCWTRAGYACTAMRFRQVLPIPGANLHPGEWRIFNTPEGERLHAMFWLLSAGTPFEFGDRFEGAGDPYLTAKALVRDALIGCDEELFVTLSSNAPLEQLSGDPGFQAVMRGLAVAGLGVSPERPPTR